MIDKYFIRPILWDYFLSLMSVVAAFLLERRGLIALPKEEYVYSIISDLSTVSLTMVGFILTLVTVLVSFKSSTASESANKNAVFDVFFASRLYFDTVRHLKNGIKSLTFIALAGYTMKLVVDHLNYEVLFYFCFGAIIIIIMTIGRSLLILSQIIKIQQS